MLEPWLLGAQLGAKLRGGDCFLCLTHRRDTLMVLSSDNGGPEVLAESGANNYPLRGSKYSEFEVRRFSWGCFRARILQTRLCAGFRICLQPRLMLAAGMPACPCLSQGGFRAAAFVSGGWLPTEVQGTTTNEMMHVADW